MFKIGTWYEHSYEKSDKGIGFKDYYLASENDKNILHYLHHYRVYDDRIIDYGSGIIDLKTNKFIQLTTADNVSLVCKVIEFTEKGCFTKAYPDVEQVNEEKKAIFKTLSDLEAEGRVKKLEPSDVVEKMKQDGWFATTKLDPSNTSFSFPEIGTHKVVTINNSGSVNVLRPTHYGGKDNPYEVFKVLKAWGLDKCFHLGNVIKYVARAGKKNPEKEIEDLEKAVVYLQYKIQTLKDKK